MTDILERLKQTTKINGAYPRDIEDAIEEIKQLRLTRDVLNKALKTTSEGNARLLQKEPCQNYGRCSCSSPYCD